MVPQERLSASDTMAALKRESFRQAYSHQKTPKETNTTQPAENPKVQAARELLNRATSDGNTANSAWERIRVKRRTLRNAEKTLTENEAVAAGWKALSEKAEADDLHDAVIVTVRDSETSSSDAANRQRKSRDNHRNELAQMEVEFEGFRLVANASRNSYNTYIGEAGFDGPAFTALPDPEYND